MKTINDIFAKSESAQSSYRWYTVTLVLMFDKYLTKTCLLNYCDAVYGTLFDINFDSNQWCTLISVAFLYQYRLIGQMCYYVFECIHCHTVHTQRPNVEYLGRSISLLEDGDPSTCIRFRRKDLQAGTHTMVLGIEYSQETVLTVTGLKMSCGVFGAQCDAFPTTVVTQGRDRAVCEGALLCGQAGKCPLVDMVVTSSRLQECSYRCLCSGVGTAICQKVVMFIDNESMAVDRYYMDIWDIAVTV